MPVFVHSIAELRNRFSYDPETGVIHWRDVPFIEWARGRAKSKQGHYLKWRREKAGKAVKFQSSNGCMGKVYFRGVSYMAPRFAWTLHHGSHPSEKHKILPIDGNWENLKLSNLRKVSSNEYYREKYTKLKEDLKPSKYRNVPQAKHPAKTLRKWMIYNPTTGNLHWQDIGWREWKKINRNKNRHADAHDEWQNKWADKVVQFTTDRRGDQVVVFKKRLYERKMLTFAIVRGYHITNAVYIYHADGDETNFRIENLKLSIRGDWVDPDEEDEFLEAEGEVTEVRWLDDDEIFDDDEVEE